MVAAVSTCNPPATGVIARYRRFLPVTDATPVVTLEEGSTPLIHSPRLSEEVGRDCRVYLKYEGLNPTGSFKDRGMTMAISKALEDKAEAVICASTGNTSAAAAAYAARASLRCVVLLPAGKIARGKLVQAFIYGARVVAVEGNFDDALHLVREIGKERHIAIVNSINPHRIEGQKTAAFEVADALGDAPDLHLMPVGNAGNITAYWKGYKEYLREGRTTRLPRLIGFQAEGAAPVYHNRRIDNPETVASAIRIGNPASWDGARQALAESHGAVDIVSDHEILEAQHWLASHEGVFVEPASAASVAGLKKCLGPNRCPACPFGQLKPGATIVLTVTGHGLKDPDTASTLLGEAVTVPARKEAILEHFDFD